MSIPARNGRVLAHPAAMSRSGLAGIALCFLGSGVGSLVLEVAWTRELRLVFGSTTLAASTILVSYMLGLGFGALAAGRLAGRVRDGVRAYGFLEIGIGLYAVSVPVVLSWFPALNRAVLYRLSFWPAALCRFAISLAVLALPTLLMGASLPVLVSALVRDRGPAGQRVALLYGLNTLGAVAGVLLATFVFFPWLGLSATSAAGAAIDLLVGLVAVLALPPRRPVGGPERARGSAKPARRGWSPLLPAYALVGFSALALEVGWSRTLAMVLGSSIHAFACMLAAFLTGIGLGSLVAGRLIERLRPLPLVTTGAIAALGLASLASTLLLSRLPQAFVHAVAALGLAPGRLVAIEFGLGVLVMLPATLVLGALFPLVAASVAPDRDAEAAVGDVYFANTIGSAAGAFAAGFVLIPALGLRGTLGLASSIDLATAGALLLAARGGLWRVGAGAAAVAAAACLLVLPIPWAAEELTLGFYREPLSKIDVKLPMVPFETTPPYGLVFYRDGLSATVSVHREGDALQLKVNGKTDASVPGDMSTQVLLAHVPLLFGPPARRALVIGFASGMTVGSAARHPLERIDVVEIEPAVFAASRFFERWNGRPLDDPRVHVIVDDGRTYLSGTPERYDVIVSEPSNPWITGVSNLFTREFFQTARHALRPGGRLMQWVQLYGLDPIRFRSILAAVRAEFPTVYLFSDRPNSGDVLILATLEPLRREQLPHWETLPVSVRHDLERVRNYSTADLWSLVRLLPADVDRIVADAPVVNSDENLAVELASPWLVHAEATMMNANWALFRPFTQGVVPLLAAEPLDAERLGALALAYADTRGDADVAAALLRASESRGPSASALATRALFIAHGEVTPEALGALDTAVALAPDAFQPRFLRAALRWASGRDADALADA